MHQNVAVSCRAPANCLICLLYGNVNSWNTKIVPTLTVGFLRKNILKAFQIPIFNNRQHLLFNSYRNNIRKNKPTFLAIVSNWQHKTKRIQYDTNKQSPLSKPFTFLKTERKKKRISIISAYPVSDAAETTVKPDINNNAIVDITTTMENIFN